MAYFEKDTPSGVLGFDLKNNELKVSAYRGRDVIISIPDSVEYMDGVYPVTAIGRKAFLSNKFLHEIHVPDSVKNIEDWGFAYCSNLERIYLHRDLSFDNGVFKDCGLLKQVGIDTGFEEKKNKDISFLLAGVIWLLDDKYLFDLKNAGSDEWLENWDKRMEVILDSPDDEGFVSLLACGEEDYEGRDNTIEGYLTKSRKRKVRICLTRLLHDTGLSGERRERLCKYLFDHRAGAFYNAESFDNGIGYMDDGYMGRTRLGTDLVPSSGKQSGGISRLAPQDETWRVILDEHGDEEEYFQIMCECGCVDSSNINGMLEDMGDRHARMKAFLLRWNADDTSSDFFSDMEL